MKTAVFYTGALRTIEKTIRFFQRNVLIGPDVYVFACVQNDSTKTNQEWESWFRDKMGSHLVSLTWFDKHQVDEWTVLREKNLAATMIPTIWKDYLRNSGSIVEYIQMFLAYQQMFHYEQKHGFQFEYIVRTRTDGVLAKPLYFHWLLWTEEDIQKRLTAVQFSMQLNGLDVTPVHTLQTFMTTLLGANLLDSLKSHCGQYIPSAKAAIPVTAADYLHYLHHGSYLLSFRVNIFYIVRRDLFYLIPCIAGMYGLIPTPTPDPYWFNAENQFQSACYYAGMSIHNYETMFEGASIYDYDERNYFDETGDIRSPSMVYCLVRA